MKDIPGYEGIYAADTDGNVWRVGAPRGKPLKPGVSTPGYHVVVLSAHGGKKTLLVHRLIALTFLGPCPEGQEVRHKNGDRTDNRASNLEYGTRAQNCADKERHGRPHRGETHPRAVLTEDQVREIRAATKGIRQMNHQYGVSRSTIEAIRARRIWPHI